MYDKCVIVRFSIFAMIVMVFSFFTAQSLGKCEIVVLAGALNRSHRSVNYDIPTSHRPIEDAQPRRRDQQPIVNADDIHSVLQWRMRPPNLFKNPLRAGGVLIALSILLTSYAGYLVTLTRVTCSGCIKSVY